MNRSLHFFIIICFIVGGSAYGFADKGVTPQTQFRDEKLSTPTGIVTDSIDVANLSSMSAEKYYKKGEDYYYGRGVKKNYEEAVKWYRLAAEKGNSSAQNNLGWMYQKGYGVTKDYAEAVKWYRKSAEQGNATGQFLLGGMYENGYGVKKNKKEAKKLYTLSAAQGLEDAKKALENFNAKKHIGFPTRW